MGHKLDVALEPGETLIGNIATEFPSHDYKRLMGFRSFRDFQGRNISAELPGWPPSTKAGEPPARTSVKGILLTSAWFGLNSLAILLSLVGLSTATLSAPEDPDELNDFPVLRADPGTFATGAPWQLDPGRNKARPRVILHVTNRRLLFTDPKSGSLLWEFGHKDIKAMTAGAVMRVTFVDGSWVRIRLVTDKDALIPEREENYQVVTVKGEPKRIPLSGEPTYMFITLLKEFLAEAPAASG
jgi:hypothetical protein